MTLLRVLHWNMQTLNKKEDNLDDLLREEKVDIALLSETRVRPNDKLVFEDYKAYTRAEEYCNKQGCKSYRGLVVMVRKGIPHTVKRPRNFETIHALGVEVDDMTMTDKIRIYAVYRPPGDDFEVDELRSLISKKIPTILAGDLNAKHPFWNSRSTNTAGRLLREDANDCEYKVAGPKEYTYYGSNSKDVIDIVVHNFNRSPTQKVLQDWGSDHRPVVFNITQTQVE